MRDLSHLIPKYGKPELKREFVMSENPTICVKCKYHEYIQGERNEAGYHACITISGIDFVTGLVKMNNATSCTAKNNGSCRDYSAKDVVVVKEPYYKPQ